MPASSQHRVGCPLGTAVVTQQIAASHIAMNCHMPACMHSNTAATVVMRLVHLHAWHSHGCTILCIRVNGGSDYDLAGV
jgi:hypothetical protein